MKKIMELFNRARGQAMVEYALLFLILTIAVTAYQKVEVKTQEAMVGTLKNATQDNLPFNEIKSPKKVTMEDVGSPYQPEVLKEIESYEPNGTPIYKNHPPVAFFNVPEKLFAGQDFTVKNYSYDVDGQIVKSVFSGALNLSGGSKLEQKINLPAGDYSITLTVEDDRGAVDVYTVNFKVEPRGTYEQIEMDHDAATRKDTATKLSTPIKSTTITEHLYGISKDKFEYNHLVIIKNFYETTTEQNEITEYEWEIPYIVVTYSGDGQRLGAVPYMDGGVQKVHIKRDTQTTPIPTDPVKEWKTNNWTYYVYDKFASNRGGDGYTYMHYDSSKGLLYNGKRIEAKKTTQNPTLTQIRDTLIIDNHQHSDHNEGWKASTATCKTCTLPNVVERFSETDNANGSDTKRSGYLTCKGVSSSSEHTVLTRTYKYMKHKSYDIYYKHNGNDTLVSGGVADTKKDGDKPVVTIIDQNGTKLQRGSEWRNEGHPQEQQQGNPNIIDYEKYEDCGVNGSGSSGSESEHCWKTHSGSFQVVEDTNTLRERTYSKGACNPGTPATATSSGTPTKCKYDKYKQYYDSRHDCNYNVTVSNSNWDPNITSSFNSYVWSHESYDGSTGYLEDRPDTDYY